MKLDRQRTPLAGAQKPFFLLVAGAVALGMGAAALWQGSQRHAIRLAERNIEARLGMEARVGGVGASARAITLHEVKLLNEDEEIFIERLAVDPDLRSLLLERRWVAEQLTIRGVEVALRPGLVSRSAPGKAAAKVDSSAPAGASVPMRFEAVSAMAARLRRILPADGSLRVEEMRLSSASENGATSHLLRVEEAELRPVDANLVLEGRATPDGVGRLAWSIALHPAKPPSGSVQLDGFPLSSLTRFLPEAPWHRPEESRLDGSLDFRMSPDGKLVVEGELELHRLGWSAPYLAEEPVVVDVSADGRAVWDGTTLRIVSSRVRTGRTEARVTGEARARDGSRQLDLRVAMRPQSCKDVMSAVPASLMGEFAGFTWDGRFGGSVHLVLDTGAPQDTELTFDLKNQCRFASAPSEAELSRFERAFVHRVRGDDEVIFSLETGPGSPHWTPLSRVSPFLIHAVLAHEDATFFRHHGFATFAIETAIERNLERGRFAYGASTISMQLAKNLFLEREKSVARKVREVFLTWWLESQLGKAQILELYLNVIEYGPEVYGIGDAARHYFGRRPSDLSGAESAFLATVLPAPRTYQRQYERGEPSEGTKRQVAALLRHMRERERIDGDALYYGLTELRRMKFHRGRGLRRPSRSYHGLAADLPIRAGAAFSDGRWRREP